MKKVCLSFNMHPRWLSALPLAEFLEPLQKAGLRGMEFLLDSNQLEWPEFADLMRDCQKAGLRLSFHAPYAAYYSLAGFSIPERRETIQRLIHPLLELGQSFSAANPGLPLVVVHGARSKTASREQLLEDTRQFLSWAAASYPGLRFALENLNPAAPDEVKVGDRREEVLRVVQELDHPRVGICWDMGHDYLQNSLRLPEEAWLKKVIHVHIHDVNEEGQDHYPLVYGRVPVQPWLNALSHSGYMETVCLEVKGHQLNGWGMERCMQSLADSFKLIQEAIP